MGLNKDLCTVDEKTGYLVPNYDGNGKAFDVQAKQTFLKVFEEEGGVAKACDITGVSTRTLYDHLHSDSAFLADYRLTLRRMESTLSSTMFKNGKEPRGYMDRITWLRKHFDEWNPKTQITVTNQSDSLDTLFTKLVSEGKAIDLSADDSASTGIQ